MNKEIFTKNFLLIFIFLYILIVGAIFQQIVLPMMPSMHAGHGILKGDNELFHQYALKMMIDIQNSGWEAWKLFPRGDVAAGANVGIAAVFYYFIYPSPFVLLPLNALLHTLSAFFLGKIVKGIGGSDLAQKITIVCFTVFPVTLIWVSQLHKDNYAVLAWILFFYNIVQSNKSYSILKRIGTVVAFSIIMLLIRPQYLSLMTILLIIHLFFNLILVRDSFKRKGIFHYIILFIFPILCLFLSPSILKVRNLQNESAYKYIGVEEEVAKVKSLDKALRPPSDCRNYTWQPTKYLGIIDSKMQSMAGIRIGQICSQPTDVNSYIDRNFFPSSALELIAYLPRAYEVGMLFPSPSQLLSIKNIKSIMALFEMCIYYFFLLALCWGLIKIKFNINLYNLLVTCSFGIVILSYVSPNMGSFHRVRYPFFILIIGMGACALSTILTKRKARK